MKKKLVLRCALESDCDLLYHWANDPETRKNSLNTEKIPYENHCQWFAGKLQDNKCDIFICEYEEEPVGQIRLDYQDHIAVISYSIAKDFRGRGFGSEMLFLAEGQVKDKTTRLMGVVKTENIASQRAFEKNGYKREIVQEGYCYKKEC